MLAVEIFNRKSIYGKAVVATANDRDAAGLMGINTSMVITFSYALSSATAAAAQRGQPALELVVPPIAEVAHRVDERLEQDIFEDEHFRA